MLIEIIMKKYLVVLFILSLSANNIFLSYGQYIEADVTTPTNVSVDASRFDEDNYDDFDASEIAYYNWWWTYGYNCRIIANSTNYYNCHGYAWHNIEGRMGQSDLRWINDIDYGGNPIYNVTKYYTGINKSYTETQTVTNHLRVSYFPRDHSAVTTEDQDSVISKWAYGPLVKHKLAQCPFYNNSEIKYYKLWQKINGTFTTFCESSERTFSSNISIPGSTYTWTKDNNLLDYVSGASTTNYRVEALSGSGKAWLRLQITTPGGEVATTDYNYLWVGKQTLDDVIGPGYYPYEGCTNTEYSFSVSPLMDPLSQGTLTWSIIPSSGYIYPYYTNYAAITFYYPHAGYRVLANIQNACGTNYAETSIYIEDCYYFSISPNPASDNVTINRVAACEENDVKTMMISSVNSNTTYDIQIVDYYGSLHLQTTKSGDSFTLPVSNLKDGTYFVKITNGKEISNLKFVVKH